MSGCSSALLATDSHRVERLPGRESQAWVEPSEAEPRNQGHTWAGPHPTPMYAIEVDSKKKKKSLLVTFKKRAVGWEGWRQEATWAAQPGPPAASGRSAAASQLPGAYAS